MTGVPPIAPETPAADNARGRVGAALAHLAGRPDAAAKESVVTAEDVARIERQRHINPAKGRPATAEDPLVGLAFSGGGIRSATFCLGVLQALRSLDVFRHVDYVSTVSGGGYVGGWLQAIRDRRHLSEALPIDRPAAGDAAPGKVYESRHIRFLRSYSNYLTPRLGLFSGDTWAAVGNTLRNLILNLGVLSLSLLAPLYLPWMLALMFWRLVPAEPFPVGRLIVAALLLVLTVVVSTLNMSQPMTDGTWSKAVNRRAATWQVLAFVVMPTLAAVWILSPIAWAWAVHDEFRNDRLIAVAAFGGLAYGAIWVTGAIAGYLIGEWQPADGASRARPDRTQAAKALGTLVFAAVVSATVGTFVAALSSRGIVLRLGSGEHEWLVGLLLFPVGVVCMLLCVTLHIGISGKALSDETREWWGRVGGVQLLLTALATLVAAMSLAGPHVWSWVALPAGLSRYSNQLNTVLGALWAGITGAGVLAGKSSRTATGGPGPLERIGRIAPGVFIVGYLLILATFLHHEVRQPMPPLAGSGTAGWSWFTFDDVEVPLQAEVRAARDVPWDGSAFDARQGLPAYELTLGLMAVFFMWLSVFASRRVDINEFSLHALYRNRIVRCFLGASNTARAAHPFTGFDPNDDLMLAPRLDPESGAVRPIRPYPLFNTALNLVGGKNLAWQQRKAAAFIFSPEYCGFEYRVDEDNEQAQNPAGGNGRGRPATRSAYASTIRHAEDGRSLSVGMAVATSGAAASPNMGYHTSPTLAFLMTVFNVRLGMWLRNPRWLTVWEDGNARLSLVELMSELLGMTTDDRSWVYLSDGGHFENLGLYELVRRRCRFIVVCDAGQDGAITFEDLGNAIEKCRADFHVNIEIDLSRIRPGAAGPYSATHCAIGTIRYDQQDPDDAPGTLLYLKSSLTGDEPADVLRYAATHPSFPHESTSDQFFDESQFESYRALGYHIACTTLMAAAEKDEMAEMSPVALFTNLRQHWTVAAPAPTDAVRKYSSALSDIWNTVRVTTHLHFLDAQMFPEWTNLLVARPGDNRAARDVPAPARPPVNYWLPDSAEERRAGFYVCSQMLQLMEDVYIEFRLDEHYDHIDNRGWMNLFQHWAWSGMLSATWAVTGSTYDPRFQRFCSRRLGLGLGTPYLFMEEEFPLPDPSTWKSEGFDKAAHLKAWEHGGARLNFFEVQLVDRFLSDSMVDVPLHLIPIRVIVQSPQRDANNLDFNVGYLIARVDWDARVFHLHHIRTQNHLRKMGLARQALRMITADTSSGGWGLTLKVVEPAARVGRSESVALDEALPSRPAALRLQRIIGSLST